MLTKRFVTLFLVFLFPAVLSSSYRRIPLTRGFFSDLTMEVGAPSQKVLVGLSFLTNDFRLICDGDGQKDQYYDPSKSSTMAKVYCDTSDFECPNKCSSSDQKEQCEIKDQDSPKPGTKVFEDVMNFENGEEIKAKFGCATSKDIPEDLPKIFERGLLGLGPLSKGSPLTKWFFASEERKKVLSVCFSKTGGGFLQLGVDPSIVDQKGVSLRFMPDFPALVFGDLQKVDLGPENLYSGKIDPKDDKPITLPLVFGSFNQNETNVPEPMLKKINGEIERICLLNDNCQPSERRKGCLTFKDGEDYEKSLDSAFPTFSMKINGQIFSWSPRQYFYVNESQICSSFKKASLGAFFVGEKLLRNKKMVINYAESRLSIIDNQVCELTNPSGNLEGGNNLKQIEQKGQNSGSNLGLFILLAILLIILLLVLYFCKTIKGFFRNQLNRLKNNQLQEQGVDGSEMSVK